VTDSVFFRRQSNRAFLDRAIPEEMLARIYEKVRWSPSCNNNQPWRCVFAFDQKQRARFMECLPLGNQWAAAAPVLIAVCAKATDDYTRSDDPVAYYQFDCGLAVMSLLLAATEEGLLTHPMAGYNATQLHAVLEIPVEYHVMCVIAMGYPGPIDQLDERNRKKDETQRTRKGLAEIICRDRFDFTNLSS
jgi:nitroreductase